METQDIRDMETAEVASGGQSDTRHHSATSIEGPLHADSMDTVRLSDSPVAALSDISPNNHTAEESLNHELAEVQEQDTTPHESAIPDVHENAIILEGDKEEFPRESMASMTSIVEDEPSIFTSGTLRSRSDSSGTLSSTGSVQVDWDELEKSEEQAPRDEGSDEVCAPGLRFVVWA